MAAFMSLHRKPWPNTTTANTSPITKEGISILNGIKLQKKIDSSIAPMQKNWRTNQDKPEMEKAPQLQ